MSVASLSGNDSISINNRIFTGLATDDVVVLTFPNEIAAVKTGKNGNSVYALNESGKQADCKIKVIRGSQDDIFLQNLLTQQQANFAGFILMIGQFIKVIGDTQGNITSDIYILSGGVFTKQVEAKSNVSGDTEQSISMYEIKFSNAPRALSS